MKKVSALFLFVLLAAAVPSFAQYQGPGGISAEESKKIGETTEKILKGSRPQAPYPGIHMPRQPKPQDKTQKEQPPQKKDEKVTPAPNKKQSQAKPNKSKKKANPRNLLWNGTNPLGAGGKTMNVAYTPAKSVKLNVKQQGEVIRRLTDDVRREIAKQLLEEDQK